MVTRRTLIRQLFAGFFLMVAAPLRTFGNPQGPQPYPVTFSCSGEFPDFLAMFEQDRRSFENIEAITNLNKLYLQNRKLLSVDERIAAGKIAWEYSFKDKKSFDEWNHTICSSKFFQREKVPAKYTMASSED